MSFLVSVRVYGHGHGQGHGCGHGQISPVKFSRIYCLIVFSIFVFVIQYFLLQETFCYGDVLLQETFC